MTEKVWYRIQVQGWISERWANWFEGMALRQERDGHGRPVTILTAAVDDQAALRGILARIWDLNLTLLSVTRTKPKGVSSQ